MRPWLAELLDVGDFQRVAKVLRHLVLHGDHHERPHGVRCRQLVDGGVFRRPMRRRVELGAQLIGGQRVVAGLEAMLLVSEDVAFLDVAFDVDTRRRRGEGCAAEADPHRDLRGDGVREVDILRAFEAVVVDFPKPHIISVCGHRAGCRPGDQCQDC